MEHIIVTWNSQGFRLEEDSPFFGYLNGFITNPNVQYLTVCLQETGNLYNEFSNISPSLEFFDELEADDTGSQYYHQITTVDIELCGKDGFQLYYYLWQTKDGGNPRCSMAILSNLPGVQFTYVAPPSTANAELYRPVLCALSGECNVYNIHAAATNTSASAAGRPLTMLQELEANLYKLNGHKPNYELLIGDFNLNSDVLGLAQNEEAVQIKQMGFSVSPPNGLTQGPSVPGAPSATWKVRQLTNKYDYALFHNLTPIPVSGITKEIGNSDHIPVSYSVPTSDMDLTS